MRLITNIQFHSNYILVVCKGHSIQDDDMNSIAQSVAQSQTEPTIVLVDVSQIHSFQSTDLSLLWLRYMQIRAKRWQVALVRVPENLHSLFASSGLEQVIPAFQTEGEALAAFSDLQKAGASAA